MSIRHVKSNGEFHIVIGHFAVSSPAIIPRRIPVALRDKVKQELDRMVSNDIITKVTEPTDYPVPTLNDVTSELAGAKHFSVLDARSGYADMLSRNR